MQAVAATSTLPTGEFAFAGVITIRALVANGNTTPLIEARMNDDRPLPSLFEFTQPRRMTC